MLSIISNRGKMAFMVFTGKFWSKVLLSFLSRVIRHVKRKVILILDSHPVHKGKETGKWLEADGDQIEIVFLPAYSPKLNPYELLDQDVKANAVGRQKPRTQMEMTHNLYSCPHRRQKMPHIARRYFHEKSVRYAAL
jgi:transposase